MMQVGCEHTSLGQHYPSTHSAGTQGAGGSPYVPGGDDAEGGRGHQNGAG